MSNPSAQAGRAAEFRMLLSRLTRVLTRTRGGLRRNAAIVLAGGILSALALHGAVAAPSYVPSKQTPPAPLREFRGVWVASVANTDWPSKPGLTVSQQKAELTAIFERAVQLRLNAVVLQVRPGCDALYASKLEPWSEYLTGQMGKAPEGEFDPLKYAVTEAHARGLELHAWVNPFRARHPSAKAPVSAGHISQTKPNLVKPYGRHLWLDPGEPAAQEHSLRVVLDIVQRYDVDGLHMDDYFYPYKEKDAAGNVLDFPDEPSWRRYVDQGGKLGRADWRRENINQFIQRTYKAVKAQKPWVKVGISPFGIWRNRVPPEIVGYDPYESLYADSRKWLANGWLDYFTPQLYWAIEARGQSFPVLLKWWEQQNSKGRHIWPGLSTRKVSGTWSPEEIVAQIQIARKTTPSAGHVHWSIKPLLANAELGQALLKGVYTEKALGPACPWLDRTPPARPKVYIGGNPSQELLTITYERAGREQPARWVMQSKRGGVWRTEVFGGDRTLAHFQGQPFPDVIAVSAVDRSGNLSPPTVFERRGN